MDSLPTGTAGNFQLQMSFSVVVYSCGGLLLSLFFLDNIFQRLQWTFLHEVLGCFSGDFLTSLFSGRGEKGWCCIGGGILLHAIEVAAVGVRLALHACPVDFFLVLILKKIV